MILEVYVNGELVDSVNISTILISKTASQKGYLHGVMKELRKKHEGKNKKSPQEFSFFITGVPSTINTFKPLKRPPHQG